MMYDITSQEIKTESPPFQEVYENSSRERINVNEILERWFSSFRAKFFEKTFFDIQDLSPIFEIDYSSSKNQFPEFKNETTLTEEFFKEIEKKKVLRSVSGMLGRLILEEKFFKGIDRTKLLEAISKIFNNFSLEKIKISENELYKRIRRILILEAASGILNELTPEQREVFEESVKRRPLFK